MSDYYNYLHTMISHYGYFAIFVALFLENTLMLGVIVPGILILLIAGYLAGIGHLGVGPCIAAGIAGTILGDNVSYLIGKYGVGKVPFLKRFVEKASSKVTSVVSTQRPYILVFFQFPVYLRVAMPAVLGTMRYPFKHWLPIDFVGSTLFNLTFIGIGFAFGRTTGIIGDALNIGTYVQYLFMALFAIWLFSVIRQIYKSMKNT